MIGMIPSPHRFSHRNQHQRSQTKQPPKITKITSNQAKITVQTEGEGTCGIIPIIEIIQITVQTTGAVTDNHHKSKKITSNQAKITVQTKGGDGWPHSHHSSDNRRSDGQPPTITQIKPNQAKIKVQTKGGDVRRRSFQSFQSFQSQFRQEGSDGQPPTIKKITPNQAKITVQTPVQTTRRI